MIKDDENCTMDTRHMGLKEENLIKRAFSSSRPQSEVSYFCYLLIDPTMILSADCCSFGEFIASIFYVGKGNKMRPMYHVERAKKLRQDKIAGKVGDHVHSRYLIFLSLTFDARRLKI